MTIAPAAFSRVTAKASPCGVKAKAGHPAVVGRPATSILSLTAKGTPQSGRLLGSGARASSASTCARSASRVAGVMKVAGSAAAMRAATPSRTAKGEVPPA